MVPSIFFIFKFLISVYDALLLNDTPKIAYRSTEKMHITNRNYLTAEEKRYIIKLVKEAYPELNWKKGGYKDGKKF